MKALRKKKNPGSIETNGLRPTLNQVTNYLKFGPRFYETLYSTILHLPSTTQFPKSKSVTCLVESDQTALVNQKDFEDYYE
jgi:hypothetical protein